MYREILEKYFQLVNSKTSSTLEANLHDNWLYRTAILITKGGGGGVESSCNFLSAIPLPVTELTSASPRLLSNNLKDLDCLLGFEYPSYFTSSPGLVSFSNPVCLVLLLCLLSSCTARSVGEGLKVLLVVS